MEVDFFIVGAQKSGTTALARFLAHHPLISIPSRKELHFFDDDLHDWSRPDFATYHRYFSDHSIDCKRGDATPSYMYWPTAIGRIHKYNPNAKLIAILRDPVARAYSHWRMQRMRKIESLDFSEAIRGGRHRVSSIYADDRVRRRHSYVERGFYAEQLTRILSFFRREQLLILLQAELLTSHGDTIAKAYRFVGVNESDPKSRSELVFSQADEDRPTSHDVDYLRLVYADDARQLSSRYGLTIPNEV